MANTWQGQFPWENLTLDGYTRTSPVASFPPNGYGLYDMIVWEWTSEPGTWGAGWFSISSPCCSARPQRSADDKSVRVIKGGSHLCAPNYCLRYRPAARQPETVDTSTGHIGIRCVVRDA
jgi:formylglycine-generating enzyme required for sulfatase activity